MRLAAAYNIAEMRAWPLARPKAQMANILLAQHSLFFGLMPWQAQGAIKYPGIARKSDARIFFVGVATKSQALGCAYRRMLMCMNI
jgi:hypothetical protein